VRRALVSVYGLLLTGEVLWSAIFPLGPYYHDRFGLNATETGVIFAASGVAILVISLPAGLFADRVGARRLALASAALLTASAFGHAIARDFWTLLVVRAVFGIAFGALWPAALAYLTDLLPDERRARVLSASIVIAGVGTTVGPVFGGTLTERFGIVWPFSVGGVIIAALSLLLATAPRTRGAAVEHQPIVPALRRLRSTHLAVGGMLFMVLPGFVANTMHLLVPLRLHELGITDAAIGWGLSAGAMVFFFTSLGVTALGERAARLVVGGGVSLVLGALLLMPIISSAVVPLFVFLVLRAPLVAVLFTISVPLTVRGADRVGVGRGTVLGLMNALWAVAAISGPIAAGFLDDRVGRNATWLVDIAMCVAAGTWAIAAGRRGQRSRPA
jgi:MFS family permease